MGYDGRDVSLRYSQADYLNANSVMLDKDFEERYRKGEDYYFFNDASAYTFDRAHRGWIGDYEFNLSGNYNDRFFWGVTAANKPHNYVVERKAVSLHDIVYAIREVTLSG